MARTAGLTRLSLLSAILLAALAFAGSAHAGGGSYVFDGGGADARAAVRAALDASAFDWDVVPVEITIHLKPGVKPHSRVGEIWLDPRLLAAGRFAWGIVQHEYAHQVAFFVLGSAERVHVRRALGGRAWCYEVRGLHHDDHACERFASLLAWSYWPSRQNVERPAGGRGGERRAFRELLSRLVPSLR